MTLKLGALFIVGAIVLIVLSIIATANNGTSLGVDWDTWASASLLSFFASLVVPDGIAVKR